MFVYGTEATVTKRGVWAREGAGDVGDEPTEEVSQAWVKRALSPAQ